MAHGFWTLPSEIGRLNARAVSETVVCEKARARYVRAGWTVADTRMATCLHRTKGASYALDASRADPGCPCPRPQRGAPHAANPVHIDYLSHPPRRSARRNRQRDGRPCPRHADRDVRRRPTLGAGRRRCGAVCGRSPGVSSTLESAEQPRGSSGQFTSGAKTRREPSTLRVDPGAQGAPRLLCPMARSAAMGRRTPCCCRLWGAPTAPREGSGDLLRQASGRC